MVIRKFQAETEEAAILQAKEELGKDAIVMNIKMVKPKGIQRFFRKPSVEVTAAVDEEKNYNTGEDMLSKMQEIQKNFVDAQKKEEEERKKKEEKQLQTDNTMAIEDRLDNLQQMLEKQILNEEKEEKEEKWDGEREKLKKENESFFSSLETERKNDY